jgi:hypothetical protein
MPMQHITTTGPLTGRQPLMQVIYQISVADAVVGKQVWRTPDWMKRRGKKHLKSMAN